jgi:hypothetical protein
MECSRYSMLKAINLATPSKISCKTSDVAANRKREQDGNALVLDSGSLKYLSIVLET